MRRLTTEEWIEKAVDLHGNKYDYSLVEYVNAQEYVTIICYTHGEFKKRAGNHLNGQGCYYCNNKKNNTEGFIEKAKIKHGNKFDYSLVEYEKASSKIKIICHNNHVFEQTPAAHLKGNGCLECLCFVRNKEQFINKAKFIHGDKYDYSQVKYTKSSTKVKIKCREHGIFEQTPSNHTNKSGANGCPKCSGFKRTTSDIVQEFKKVHGDTYDYSLIEYKGAFDKVIIKCKIHGDFECSPDNHLHRKGCPKCGRDRLAKYIREKPQGWNITSWQKKAEQSKTFDSFKVYIIRCWNEYETFYKIGRTYNKVKTRFAGKNMPYKYEVIKEIVFDNARECFNKENELKRLHKEYKYIPKIKFAGVNECFNKILI